MEPGCRKGFGAVGGYCIQGSGVTLYCRPGWNNRSSERYKHPFSAVCRRGCNLHCLKEIRWTVGCICCGRAHGTGDNHRFLCLYSKVEEIGSLLESVGAMGHHKARCVGLLCQGIDAVCKLYPDFTGYIV